MRRPDATIAGDLHIITTVPLRFITERPMLESSCWMEDVLEEVPIMAKLRPALIAMVPLVWLTLAPVNDALADGHRFGHGHGHGYGGGPVGAVAAVVGVAAAIVAAPFLIIRAATESVQPAPAYYPQQAYYPPPAGPGYPPPAYYPPPPPPGYAQPPAYNYGPPPGYYPPPPTYYPAPPAYYPQQQGQY